MVLYGNTSCSCLLKLQPGESGCIRHFGHMDPILKQRLADLGVTEGADITIMRYSFWGGPVTLECGGQLIGIRKHQAAHIEVAIS
ncbi:FeoA family protein [Paenibacillus fonticola]|uniref:FeoA family protein n=1 Tax=Paenibacillus fonticola TaxID=379896 RepID=UPI000376F6AC|nr:FeoA family protein [Paenibacillus fonticola]